MAPKQRLSPDDWLKAGIDALARLGPEGLKAEPLARGLQTTKGSFYWHFADVPTFQQQVLEYWGRLNDAPADPPAKKKEAVAELKTIMEQGIDEDLSAEAAMRAWARTDPAAAAMLSTIDAQRLARIKLLLDKIGVTNPDIARALYAARIGMTQIAKGKDKSNRAAIQTLVDLVLALR
ncbi:TetR/AcrR family transcriptional regulator [Pseudooceanicola sp.]|uniref:TetR/AcrR family transcriptional regulator n=1 Tax=Pseudooceanicola sp. TaxID=1914328 RepID=UPI00261185E3|nr:TetR/AcrR family transcriptional regulator [Pseudooceanicola sp.]MDF1854535.1 TetR/AcrR family transcriptional regulator [Pseudooceanicola sp.]